MACQGHEEALGDGNVLYLDGGAGCTGFDICWTHQIVHSEYVKLTVLKSDPDEVVNRKKNKAKPKHFKTKNKQTKKKKNPF